MLAVYFIGVFLAFFLKLRAVDAQFMASDSDAEGAIALFSKYGCSATASDAQITQAMICQQSIDATFYEKLENASTGKCKSLVTETSSDSDIGNFCKSLKGPNDAKSIELMKCVLNEAGRLPDATKSMNNEKCVEV